MMTTVEMGDRTIPFQSAVDLVLQDLRFLDSVPPFRDVKSAELQQLIVATALTETPPCSQFDRTRSFSARNQRRFDQTRNILEQMYLLPNSLVQAFPMLAFLAVTRLGKTEEMESLTNSAILSNVELATELATRASGDAAADPGLRETFLRQMVGPTFDRAKARDVTDGCNLVSGEEEFAAILAGTGSTPSSMHYRELIANDVFMSFSADHTNVPPTVLPMELRSDYVAQMRVKHALCVADRFDFYTVSVPQHLCTLHVASMLTCTRSGILSFAHLFTDYLPDSPEMFDFFLNLLVKTNACYEPDELLVQLPLALRIAMARSRPMRMLSGEWTFGDINECPADVWMDAIAPAVRDLPRSTLDEDEDEEECVLGSDFPDAVLASPSKLLRLVRLGWSLQHFP